MLTKRIAKVFVWITEGFLVVGLLYMLFAPAYPWLRYKQAQTTLPQTPQEQLEVLQAASHDAQEDKNMLVIPKLGVRTEIVEAPDERGLERGAWRMPQTARPGEAGNAVITAHRFKYLPPHNQTFYNLHELAVDDTFAVYWEGERLLYEIIETKVVDASQVAILDDFGDERITLFTCHPLFSTKERLVVVARPISDDSLAIR